MRPMTRPERLMISAMYELRQPQTAAAARAEVAQRHSWATGQELDVAFATARIALQAAQNVAGLQPGQPVAAAFGTNVGLPDALNVEVLAAIDVGGAEREYRTIRTTIPGLATRADLDQYVEDVIDDTLESYGIEEANATYTVIAIW